MKAALSAIVVLWGSAGFAGSISTMTLPEEALPDAAKPAAKVSGIDFLVDWKSLIGKRVHIGGCKLRNANAGQSMLCSVRNQDNDVGRVWILSPSLDREDLRRALKECAAYDTGPTCNVEVSGTVGRLRNIEEPTLANAKIHWP